MRVEAEQATVPRIEWHMTHAPVAAVKTPLCDLCDVDGDVETT